MKRMTVLLLTWVVVHASSDSVAQPLIVNINLATPMPSLISEWQRNPSLVTAQVLNNTGVEVTNAAFSFTIRDLSSNVVAANSKDNSPSLPRFTIPIGQSTFTGQSMINTAAVDVNPGYKTIAATTGRLPEGQYEFCVRVLDATGVAIPATGTLCVVFTVIIPDPPTLLHPADRDTIQDNTLPTFAWTPTQIAGEIIQYRLKIVPIYTGQDRRTAIDNNQTLVNITVPAPTYQYSPSDPPFTLYSGARGFAWQVQALNREEVPATRNEGKSEIREFCTTTTCRETTVVAPCNCQSSPIVTPVRKAALWEYKVTGTFDCTGTASCAVQNKTIEWKISSGADVAKIEGSATAENVSVRPLRNGQFVLAVNVKVTCTDGTTCTGYANAEETITTVPPDTTGCKCEIAHEWLGGPPIKIEKNLTTYSAQDYMQGIAVGISALASDKDILVQKCIKNGVREKFIRDIGDPVSYAWEVEAGDKTMLIGSAGSSVLYALPHKLKKGEKHTAKIKLTIRSANDDAIVGRATITATGKDTCGVYEMDIKTEPIKEAKPKERPPVEIGTCIPVDEIWIQNGEIAASIAAPGPVQMGEITLLELSARDPDLIKLICESPGECTNPEETVDTDEPFFYTWTDGGAGGSFVLGADGSSVLYLAPAKKGDVSITCEVRDNGTHRAASGEKKTVATTLKVYDALTEMNIRESDKTKKFLTVGLNQFIEPQWIEAPKVIVVKADYCSNLGGTTGKFEATKESKGLTKKEASLHFTPDPDKDNVLDIAWKAHSHIHAKHHLFGRITFKFEGQKIFYTDTSWEKSDFMVDDLHKYKLFFDKEGKLDDGKWRANKAQDYDVFGKETKVNGTTPLNWFTHWSADTYDPCPDGYRLTSKDPPFKYGTPPSKNAIAEYSFLANEIIIGPKTAKKFSTPGFTATWTSSNPLITSDKKRRAVELKLPKYELEGIKFANKVIHHELAHFESFRGKWSAAGEWATKYGPYTPKKKRLTTFSAVASKEVSVHWTKLAPVPDDQGDKYSLSAVIVHEEKGKKKTTSRYTIEIGRGWFESEPKESRFVYWSEHDAAAVVKESTATGVKPIASLTGFIIDHNNSLDFIIYARANDEDGDWIPNLEEDAIGMMWNNDATFGEAFYHPVKEKNDREVWAEWRTKELVDPVCTEEKDWANPGLQTSK